jgi:stage II sporulation protein D
MKKILGYLGFVLIITIMLPTVIVKTFNFVPNTNSAEGKGFEDIRPKIVVIEEKQDPEIVEVVENITVFNVYANKPVVLPLEEYIKGVVAAEMPAAFHIEALKAQAIAARTYAISRTLKYNNSHPDHPEAAVCTGIHCQAYLSLEELTLNQGESWVENYWAKIEEAVDSTKGLLLYYNGEIIEPLFHSTSGGMTEDSVNVFASDAPYLKSVTSPYEEDAPKYKTVVSLTGEEFIDKLNKAYPNAKINKDNLGDKIKLIEKSPSGRVKKVAVDKDIINGSAIRTLFGLNSTNFKISYDKKINLIEILTYGYGHGVGMSQWGANGMGKNGSNFEEILKHYYTGIEIK